MTSKSFWNNQLTSEYECSSQSLVEVEYSIISMILETSFSPYLTKSHSEIVLSTNINR